MKLLMLLYSFSMVSNDTSSYIKGRGYEGYIFDDAYLVLESVQNQKSRYTPTENDVKKAETLLKEKLPLLNKNHINQTENCPILEKKLRKYKRQYFGFENTNQEKILWVNFLWGSEFEPKISKELITVLDGCSYYWNIKINITTGEVFDLYVNGSA